MTETLKQNFLLQSYNIFATRAIKISDKRIILNKFWLIILGLLLITIVYLISSLEKVSLFLSLTLCIIPLIGMILSFLWFKDIDDIRKVTKCCYQNLAKIEKEINTLIDTNNDNQIFCFFCEESRMIQERKYFMTSSKKDYVLKLLKSDYLLSIIFEITFVIFFFINFKSYLEMENYSAIITLILIIISSFNVLLFSILLKSSILEDFSDFLVDNKA